MMKHQIEILCAVSAICGLGVRVMAFEATPVAPIESTQKTPDVDNGRIVWAEEGGGDWDVYGADLIGGYSEVIYVAAFIGSDQIAPSIWNDRVVFQHFYLYNPPNPEGDWDVYVSDISDANVPVPYLMTPLEADYLDDQIAPAIHGNTAVWQSYVIVDDGQGGTIEDWDIYAADITDPNNAIVYIVDEFPADQQQPAVYHSKVIYQDNTDGDWDIWQANVWLRDDPQYRTVFTDEIEPKQNQTAPAVWGDIVVYEHETTGGDIDIYGRDMSRLDDEPFLIAGGLGSQQAPDISGHLVVWEDDRNGNWDIYGYNLITRQEFLITTETAASDTEHSSHQRNPAISGSLVVWEDSRVSPVNIYYAWLDGDAVADCPIQIAGDIDGNCQVNLIDFVMLTGNWLTCGLEPMTACDP